ncbi:hypothetical protein C448_09807 [Halococcus morrhuae DSM 1307]|uniref:DUF3006 domain-containing protein n=1 Tax=Halococcus morrhuae DSM 1307 TaxID=931277 RepID=M0MGD7_HALMO|nr:DUF3006 domain-containing protein [Halococcus morrhuae]EMA43475.1 hypothetical protein C448_09807 [Halococcus morrhuae DSM 1307]
MSTETYRGVLDRFEGDLAVVLLEQDAKTVDDIAVEREKLPSEGHHRDAIFTVELENDTLKNITYRPQETTTRSDEAQSRFDQLSERPQNNDDQ